MKKKFSFCLLAFVMAIIMAVVTPAQVIATSTNKQYIKEIRIGYGQDGKDQLKKAKYTILCDNSNSPISANEGGDGEAVYLGYITTTNKEEAITDIAVMPMGTEGNREYSFDAYTEEMKNINAQITQQVQDFGAAILEFRNNFKKAEPYNQYALRAYNLLNMFTEDDTLVESVTQNADGTETKELVPAKLGDLLLDESYVVEAGPVYSEDYTPPEVYRNILMMGNSTVVSAINNALVLGCAETKGDTFLDRLAKAEYVLTLTDDNHRRFVLANIIESFSETLLLALDTYDTAVAYPGGKEAYIKQFELNPKSGDQNLANNGRPYDAGTYDRILEQLLLIDIMKKIPYGNCEDDNDETLYFLDAMLLPSDYTDDGSLALTDQIIDVLAKSMTPGQLSIAQYTGLAPLIFYAYNVMDEGYSIGEGKTYSTTNLIDDYLNSCKPNETVSVYAGVDRSIFNDTTNTVAITSAAIQSKAASGSLGRTTEYTNGNSDYLLVGAAGIILTGVSIAAAVVHGVKMYSEITNGISLPAPKFYYTYTTKIAPDKEIISKMTSADFNKNLSGKIADLKSQEIAAEDAHLLEEPPLVYESSLSTKIKLGVDVIMAIIGIVIAVMAFIRYKQSKKIKDIDYDNIPRAIIDVRYKEDGGQGYYFNYYAAKLPNVGDEDYKTETDTTKLYGDLNGLNKMDPWLCLYYARDLRLGSPLTPAILFQNTAELNSFKRPYYLPVHSFSYSTTLGGNYNNYTPYNLNKFNGRENAPELYLFFARDTSVKTISATLFADIFNWSALVSFLVGGALTGVSVWFAMKRKKSKAKIANA